MSHIARDKKQLLTRVRRIKGQAEALERKLEQTQEQPSESDCTALLQQIAAIRGATNGLMTQVLEGHLRAHLGAHDLTPDQRDIEVDEVIGILKSYLK
jgi:DNA-binding FrmR family transcriptional regulator